MNVRKLPHNLTRSAAAWGAHGAVMLAQAQARRRGTTPGGSSRSLAHDVVMPRISAFYGIVITMYWRDHPPPHFHAAYGGQVAEIAIETLEVIDGWLPPRALRLVIEWASQHQDELMENWERARAHERLVAIDPLP